MLLHCSRVLLILAALGAPNLQVGKETMMKHKILLIATLLIISLLTSGCARQVSFSQQVKPILDKHCLPCHAEGGSGYESSGFSVTDYDSVAKGTTFGPVTAPGASLVSTLVILIEYKHAPVSMPPGRDRLTEEEISTIKQWIDQGAKNN